MRMHYKLVCVDGADDGLDSLGDIWLVAGERRKERSLPPRDSKETWKQIRRRSRPGLSTEWCWRTCESKTYTMFAAVAVRIFIA